MQAFETVQIVKEELECGRVITSPLLALYDTANTCTLGFSKHSD
jgi:hypothetical protein